MHKFTPVAASVILLLSGTSFGQTLPNKVVVQTPEGVTLKITRRTTNTSKQVLVTVNKQDTVEQVFLYVWKKVADEGKPFAAPAYPALVRYGVDGFWIEKTVLAGGECTNEFFGSDPRVGVVKRCEYFTGPAPIPPIQPPTNHGSGLPIDVSSLPVFQPGIDFPYLSEPRPQEYAFNDGNPANWEHDGAVRTVCNPTRVAQDDPIVSPGLPGAAHWHTFFGNANIDAFTTPTNIRNAGNKSSCRGGTINLSGYWVPTMRGADGKAVMPRQILLYYKTGFGPYMDTVPATIMQDLPPGLRIVAGDAKSTAPTQGQGGFSCLMPALGYDRPIPTGKTNKQIPDWCAAGDEMWQHVEFPQCWDGVNLDSPDHKSHMSYPVENTAPHAEGRSYRCPTTHPVLLPRIAFSVMYVLPPVIADMAKWRLASDVYDAALPGGYSNHGDWMNGWDPTISHLWGEGCMRARRNCGSHEVGDGRVALEFQGN